MYNLSQKKKVAASIFKMVQTQMTSPVLPIWEPPALTAQAVGRRDAFGNRLTFEWHAASLHSVSLLLALDMLYPISVQQQTVFSPKDSIALIANHVSHTV